MATTARNIIESSLRLIGAIAVGETPSASEYQDALRAMNQMLESWSIQGLMSYKTTREVFPFISSQQSYTMGPLTADFATSRPAKINGVSIITNNVELPIEIITVDRWQEVLTKNTTSTVPTKVYIEGSAPFETLNFWPIPEGAGDVVIYSEKSFSEYLANDAITLPPGYLKAMRYNLALELAPEYGKEPSGLVMQAAMESISAVKRQNTKPVYMKSDVLGLVGIKRPFNIITGE